MSRPRPDGGHRPAGPPTSVIAGLRVDGEVRRDAFTLRVATQVAAGESLAVLGPNGAGKSTLLRAFAGLLPLSAGRIELDGVVLDDADTGVLLPPERRRVGLVFQGYRLFPHLSVRDNVAFGPRSTGLSRRASRAAADVWLQALELTALAGRRPHEVSGGQAQRVALARALASDPRLLLLDEPMAALDARTRLEVRTTLREHLRDFAGPVVVVTHDPLEAMVMADRLLVLEGGRVVQEGSPVEVARRPATDYVARLVGLNLYAGMVVAEPGGQPQAHVVLDSGGVLHVTGLTSSGLEVGDRVLVAARPAAVSLHTRRPGAGSPRNVWRGEVAGLEPSTDRVRVQVRGEPDVLVDV
ncbi:MAG TPA: ABC transporter ATP-binding protein, partial [Actinomycetales bacterium]|nr:ABC transporter ATP-binding protein [Actinomycetales bacterium]